MDNLYLIILVPVILLVIYLGWKSYQWNKIESWLEQPFDEEKFQKLSKEFKQSEGRKKCSYIRITVKKQQEGLRMSLIKEINILGIIYKVEEVQVVCKETPRIGEINYMTQTIKIDSTLSVERKRQVLIHEILHGIFELLGFDEINDDEKMVQSIATAMYQVFSNQAIFS